MNDESGREERKNLLAPGGETTGRRSLDRLVARPSAPATFAATLYGKGRG
jgi:hypothetical protein